MFLRNTATQPRTTTSTSSPQRESQISNKFLLRYRNQHLFFSKYFCTTILNIRIITFIPIIPSPFFRCYSPICVLLRPNQALFVFSALIKSYLCSPPQSSPICVLRHKQVLFMFSALIKSYLCSLP
jgi:hypothetical protein